MKVPSSRPATVPADADTARPSDAAAPTEAGDLFAVLVAALAAGSAPSAPLAPGDDPGAHAAAGANSNGGADSDATDAPAPALTALLAAAAQAGALGIVATTPATAAGTKVGGTAAGAGPAALPGAAGPGDVSSATPPGDAPTPAVPATPAAPATPGASAGLQAMPAAPAGKPTPSRLSATGPAGDRGAGPGVRVQGVASDADKHQDPASTTATTGISTGQNPQLDGPQLTTRAATPHNSTVVGATVGRQMAEAVGDHVARLVSRGDGTRRLTLQLQPVALGDVRITLTVRAGQVHVAMAAGTEAQAALLRDAPELHRLLERVGATQPQIVVRDLSAAPVVAGPATTAQPDGRPTDQSSAGPGTGLLTSGQQGAALGPHTGGHPQDRRAWTPAATSARDGGQPAPGRSDPDRPIEPATRVRTAGVDVSM